MRIAVKAAERFGYAVGFLEDDGGAQAADEAGLAREAELGGEIVVNAGDDMHWGYSLLHVPQSAAS